MPDMDTPDWPHECPSRPAGARERGYLEWHEYAEARTARGGSSGAMPILRAVDVGRYAVRVVGQEVPRPAAVAGD